MILFQNQIQEHQKLAEHYRDLAAKREALAAGLMGIQQQADSDLSSLKLLLDKCKEVAPDAIASLKSAVLNLFSDGDGGNDGGNQPTDPMPDSDPTPGADDEEPGLIALNGITGDCLISSPGELEPERDNPVGDDHILQSAKPLTGQSCAINPDLYWAMTTTPDGSSWEFASSLACQLEDCPKSSLTGQYCNLATPFACIIDPQPQPLPSPTEMVHLSANCGYLKLRQNGRVLSVYCWFSRKNIAESWASHLEAIPAAKIEMRESKRNSSWKWELKIIGLTMQQIERLSKEALHQKPSSKAAETPALAAGIEPPSDWGKVQIEESGADPMTCILSCGDVVEVIGDRYPQHCGKVGTVEGIANFSELPLLVRTPLGKKPYRRSDLKLIAKGKPQLMTAAVGADDAEDF